MFVNYETETDCTWFPFLIWVQFELIKGQRLPVKTSGKASFYGEKLHCGRFYDRLERERDYVIYVHFYVNLDGRVVGLLLLDLQ